VATNCHGHKAQALNRLATHGAETARRVRRDEQAACQMGLRESVFDPWNGKEPAKTARKPRF